MAKSKKTVAQVVGARVREFRGERGWGQVDLEAHLDESPQQASLSAIENGRKYTSCRTVERFAEAFEVEPARFFLAPADSLRHRVADAVLNASQAELRKVAGVLALEDEG